MSTRAASSQAALSEHPTQSSSPTPVSGWPTADRLWPPRFRLRLSQCSASPAQSVFAYVTGNGDAHSKNFSILQDTLGRWGPEPAYDLPSSQPYGDNTLALSVAGKRDGNIPGQRYVDLGQQLGLPERAARRVVVEIARSVDEWIDGISSLPLDQGRLHKLKKVVARRQQMLDRSY